MTARPPIARIGPRPSRRRGLAILVPLVALVFVLPALIQLAAEWLWFQEVGYQRVFTTRLLTETVLALVVGGAVFGFFYGNLRFAQRGVVPEPPLFPGPCSALPSAASDEQPVASASTSATRSRAPGGRSGTTGLGGRDQESKAEGRSYSTRARLQGSPPLPGPL